MVLALIEGLIVGVKKMIPKEGQDFKPHIRLSVLQKNDGEAETIRIKENDFDSDYHEDEPFSKICFIKHWQMGGRSGLSVGVSR